MSRRSAASRACREGRAIALWDQADLDRTPLNAGWRMVGVAADSILRPADLRADLHWLPAAVPGTVAAALRAAGRWSIDAPAPLHHLDHWFQCRLASQGPQRLRFGGLATQVEAWLDDERLFISNNMFLPIEAAVRLRGGEQLSLRFRALSEQGLPRLPRARWRQRLIGTSALRRLRTTALGHIAGWCPLVHAIGPFRPVEILAEAALPIAGCDLRAELHGADGLLLIELHLADDAPATLRGSVTVAGQQSALERIAPRRLRGRVAVPDVAAWWPHTHGEPVLHPVTVLLGDTRLECGDVGFRHLALDRGADGQGFGLLVNGVPVFCRGACWMTADLVTLTADPERLAPILRQARDAGLNMLRVVGTALYESEAFYRLCDQLGLLVWQDAPFANFDYPSADPAFRRSVTAEIAAFLDRTQAHPALAVLCGGSEIAQQAAMLGLPPGAAANPLFDEIMPALVRQRRPDILYVPHSPGGAPLAFQPDSGPSHYFGVGGYLRPIADARRAEVRFASECLAIANLPDAVDGAVLAEWAPRDGGAAWNFADVRDHYLTELFAEQPARLRREDPARYRMLSRAVSAELMAAVFAEWRRPGSSCRGGLVLQLQDLRAGGGWGLLDSAGRPKSAWHGLRQACRPVQLLLSDEGLNGLYLHVLNEAAADRPLRLELACLRDGEVPVAQGAVGFRLQGRGSRRFAASELLGGFFDTTYAYRFGPREHSVSVATLTCGDSGALLSEASHRPQGLGLAVQDIGLVAALRQEAGGWHLAIAARAFAQSVHLDAPGWWAAEDWFHLAPSRGRSIRLHPVSDEAGVPEGEVWAINARVPTSFRWSGAAGSASVEAAPSRTASAPQSPRVRC